MENDKTAIPNREMGSKPKITGPSMATLMIVLIGIMAILTHLVPAGSFERLYDETTGRNLVVPGSFAYIESEGISFFEFLQAPFDGLIEGGELVGIILLAGGGLGVIIETGAIHAAISTLLKKVGKREYILFIAMMVTFAAGSSLLGLGEEYICLLPVLIAVFKSLGYDPLVAVMVLVLGNISGHAFAITSPFGVVIGQNIAELPLLSGMGLRTFGCIGSVSIAITYVILTARRKLKTENHGLITISNMENTENAIDLSEYEMTKERKIVLIITLIYVIILVYGVAVRKWWLGQMSGIFFAMGITGGLFYYKKINYTVDLFVKKASEMAEAAILLALSRGIMVVMQNGQISDTLVNAVSKMLTNCSGVVAAWALYYCNILINFMVPSASGQAAVVMPIMTPLADLVGVTRQTAVLCFLSADSIGNIMVPTQATLLACLSIAKVPFTKWLKFAWKAVLLLSLWTMIVLFIAVKINWGPF